MIVPVCQFDGGLGQVQTGQIVTGAVSTAGAIATPAIAHAISTAAWAVPVVGAAVAGVTLALTAIFSRKGPQQKIISSQIVDELEPQLQANVAAYLAGPRTRESQQVALSNFDAAWDWLVQNLSRPELGEPGRRGIRDRSRGGQWDWFAYYRDPIANDVPVSSDAAVAELLASAGLGGSGDWWMLAAAGVLILVGVLA